MPVSSSMRVHEPSCSATAPGTTVGHDLGRAQHLAVRAAHEDDVAVLDATGLGVHGGHEALLWEGFAQAGDGILQRMGAPQGMGRPQQKRELVGLRADALLRIADLPLADGRDGGIADGVDHEGQRGAADLELAGGRGQRIGLGVGDEGREGLRYDGPFLHRVLVDAGLFELGELDHALLRGAGSAEGVDVLLGDGEQRLRLARGGVRDGGADGGGQGAFLLGCGVDLLGVHPQLLGEHFGDVPQRLGLEGRLQHLVDVEDGGRLAAVDGVVLLPVRGHRDHDVAVLARGVEEHARAPHEVHLARGLDAGVGVGDLVQGVLDDAVVHMMDVDLVLAGGPAVAAVLAFEDVGPGLGGLQQLPRVRVFQGHEVRNGVQHVDRVSGRVQGVRDVLHRRAAWRQASRRCPGPCPSSPCSGPACRCRHA